jgi:SAM-dependent methyltransferase
MNYDSFSTLYDKACPGVDGDIEFINSFIADNKIQNFLEVGAGTGRILSSLNNTSAQIVGIEPSREMYNLCLNKCQVSSVQAKIFNQDLSSFESAEKFDFIILAYRTFMHFLTQTEQLHALQKIRSLLSNNGHVLIDLFNPDLKRIAKEQGYFLLESKDNYNVWVWEEFNIPKQTVSNIYKLDITNTDGTTTSITSPFDARWTYPSEFELLVKLSGLSVSNTYSDYSGAPFTGTEPCMIYLLKKE